MKEIVARRTASLDVEIFHLTQCRGGYLSFRTQSQNEGKRAGIRVFDHRPQSMEAWRKYHQGKGKKNRRLAWRELLQAIRQPATVCVVKEQNGNGNNNGHHSHHHYINLFAPGVKENCHCLLKQVRVGNDGETGFSITANDAFWHWRRKMENGTPWHHEVIVALCDDQHQLRLRLFGKHNLGENGENQLAIGSGVSLYRA